MADWHEINNLFHVVEKASGHPHLAALRAEAMAQLEKEAAILKAKGGVATALAQPQPTAGDEDPGEGTLRPRRVCDE